MSKLPWIKAGDISHDSPITRIKKIFSCGLTNFLVCRRMSFRDELGREVAADDAAANEFCTSTVASFKTNPNYSLKLPRV